MMFKNKNWLPTKCNVKNMNVFIHALNLGLTGPLFSDVQTFLRVYAMTKRISLLKTQVMFLDQELRYAPLNRIVYNQED